MRNIGDGFHNWNYIFTFATNMYYWFQQSFYMAKALPFIGGWLADRLLGDPEGWPHPVVGFGKVISLGEKTLNKGNDRAVKGGVMALVLVAGTYLLCERILALAGYFYPLFTSILVGIGVFYCLAGKTLIKEVKAVFSRLQHGRRTQTGRADRRPRHIPPLPTRDTGRRPRNARRKPERRCDSSYVLVCPARAPWHDSLQDGKHARFDDRLQK